MPTLHEIMTSSRSSGEPGPDLGPGPGLPAEAEAELPPGPGPRPPLCLRAPDCQAELGGHQAHQAGVGLFQKMIQNSFIHFFLFTEMLHNWSLFFSEQVTASRLELTAARLAVRHRPAPSSVNLMSPPVPVSPSPTPSYFMWPSEWPTLAGFRVWAWISV